MFVGIGIGVGMAPPAAGGGKPIIPPYLDDPAATARGMTISSVGPDYLTFAADAIYDANGYAMPMPPAGSVVEFDMTNSKETSLIVDDNADLLTPGSVWLVNQRPAGTHHIVVTIPAGAALAWLGFRAWQGAVVQITNWRVRAA